MKYTPGPWKYLPEYDEQHWTGSKSVYVDDGTNYHEICTTTRGGQEDANVLLIAAAPELLEALSNMTALAHAYVGDDPKGLALVAKATAAIFKAKGRA